MKWKKEISRDLLALGSIPFLILYLARIWMVDNYTQMFQIGISIILLLTIWFVYRKFDYHISIITILAFFTSYFYNDIKFAIFAGVIFLTTIFTSIKYLKRKYVYSGILVGIITTLIGYLVPVPF